MHPHVYHSNICNSQNMEQPKCPPTDEWIKTRRGMWYIYIFIQWSAISRKKGEVFPFATTWMDLKGMTPSKISQIEKDIYCTTLLIICGMQK